MFDPNVCGYAIDSDDDSGTHSRQHGSGRASPGRGMTAARGARRGPARARLLAAVTLVALTAAGCGGHQSTLAPRSRPAKDISQLWWVMLVASAVIFAIVVMLVLLAIVRHRGQRGGPVNTRPAGTRLILWGGAVIPGIVLFVLFLATVETLEPTAAAKGRSGDLRIEVSGRQWFWDVDYPDQHFRTANEIHIPVGEAVSVGLRTDDVIHSFWVPQLNRKVDMIPGQTNHVVLEADRPGVFRGQCAEFCGLEHAHMAFYVVAQPRPQFEAWLANEERPAPQPATAHLEQGQQVLLGSACVYCHAIQGTNASGRVGPDLTHLASRRSIAAGTLPLNRGTLAGWILDPQHIKPGNYMPATNLDGPHLQALVDYLMSLR
jgi:cytochrome c oxidase subunit 2